MHKITKKVLKSHGAELELSECGDWLFAGAWMVKRETVDGAEAWTDAERLRLVFGGLARDPKEAPRNLARIVPDFGGEAEKFERTTWTATHYRHPHSYGKSPVDLVLYVGDRGNVAFIKREFADFLEPLHWLWGRPGDVHADGYHTGPFADSDRKGDVLRAVSPHRVSTALVAQGKALAAALKAKEGASDSTTSD